MDDRFKKLTDKMPSLLHSLLEQPLVTIDDIGITEVPQNGVYVFLKTTNLYMLDVPTD